MCAHYFVSLEKAEKFKFLRFFYFPAQRKTPPKKSAAFFILSASSRLLEPRLLHELAAKGKGRRVGDANLLKRARQRSGAVEDDNAVADGAARHLD